MFHFKKLLLFTSVLVFLLGLGAVTAHADENKTGTVTASTLNLRSSANTSSSIVSSLKKGETLTILSTANNWHQVKAQNGKTGWVSSTYVSIKTVDAAQPAGSKTGVVTATTLNLRSSASTSASAIGSLKKGEALTILSSSKNWYNVKAENGKTGWVSSSYVAIKDASISRGSVTREQTQASADLGLEIVSYAKTLLGVRYVYGGMSTNGFDCSGFVKYVFDHFDIKIERVSSSQANQGEAVNKSDLKPGDLVFFDTNGGHNQINHAGIYIGEGSFIHASSGSSAKKVVISTLNSGFYQESYMRARRLF